MRGLSRTLNVYCEPAAFLTEGERQAFEPIAFYGSLPSIEELEARALPVVPRLFADGAEHLRVYVSFGTIVWRHFADTAVEALNAISTSLGHMEGVRAIVSLGGVDLDADTVRSLSRPNVSVRTWVDQWHALREADVFVTHQGMNSTHEAIYHGVPMLAYPFFADQPALAERCRALGLSLPLTSTPRGTLTPQTIEAGFAELASKRESLTSRLAQAREWELETLANRTAVHHRIAGLIGQTV
jgi:UDP:flavonoid glycosyltransferase YjiC (YdhE family)